MTSSRPFSLPSPMLLFLLAILGYTLRIRRISWLALHGISFSSPGLSITVRTLSLRLHIPRPSYPRWATISLSGVTSRDSDCTVSLANATLSLWLFPVLFGFTAGPWVTTSLDGFSACVFSSKQIPRWVDLLRGNIIYTILDGDTIRLHNLKTKIFFSGLTGSEEGYNGEVEKPGVRPGEEHDEIRVRLAASQWHIMNIRHRMYNFGELEMELRRSWVDGRGSFVMISEGGRWVKLAAHREEDYAYLRASFFLRLIHGIYSFPSNLFRIARDPLSTVDILVTRCDITFENFQLRDAQLLKDATMKLRREYSKYDAASPGVLKDAAWDMFVDAVVGVCGLEVEG